MTQAQAQAAAGVVLTMVGDGVYHAVDGAKVATGDAGLSASFGAAPFGWLCASDAPGAPRVTTPEGVQLGDPVGKLNSVYGNRLRYVPAPTTGGISPKAGYVVTEAGGNLVFLVTGGMITNIAAGPDILPSTVCY